MPDSRGFIIIGVFLLVGAIFAMIGINPALTSNQGFMFLSQTIVVTGFVGLVLTFYFGNIKKDPPDPNATTSATTTVTTIPQPEPPTQ
jgi:uncharacterized membrane-anchored protein